MDVCPPRLGKELIMKNFAGREFVLHSRVIAQVQQPLDEQSLKVRRQMYREELEALFPILRNQHLAHIDFRVRTDPQGLVLDAVLVESRQLSLHFPTKRIRQWNGRADGFSDLIESLRNAQHQMPVEITLSASDVELIDPLQRGTPLDARVIELRRAARTQRNRPQGMPPNPELAAIQQQLPHVAPVVEPTRIQARVTQMSATWAMLNHVKELRHVNDVLSGRSALPKQLHLLRDIRSNTYVQHGQALLKAMDTRSPISMDVNIQFSGVDAQVYQLELRTIP